jgi:hypothetical protein
MVSKKSLGTKRLCQSCTSLFYDLSKDPITCPKCAAIYDTERVFSKKPRKEPIAPLVFVEPGALILEDINVPELLEEEDSTPFLDPDESLDDSMNGIFEEHDAEHGPSV